MKKIIVVLTIIFFILILLNFLLKKLDFKKKSVVYQKLSLTKNKLPEKLDLQKEAKTNSLSSSNSTDSSIKTNISYKTLSFQETEKLNNLQNQLPIENTDFSIDYSSYLNTLFVSPKNKDGKEKAILWLKEQGLENLLSYNNLVIFTPFVNNQPDERNASEYKDFKENSYSQHLQTSIQAREITTSPSVNPTFIANPQNNFSLLIDFLRILTSLSTTQSNNQTANEPLNNSPNLPNQSLTPPISPLPSSPLISLSLSKLFQEAGSKVGVPPKILEAVMKVESPSTFNYSNEEISLYSQPGNSIPNCFINTCSEKGPMQFTTGVDRFGTNNCPGCAPGYCPNAWASYGQAINIYGDYSHTPDPCNIKDSIYAAAFLLKTGARAANPFFWTQEEVYRAITRYNGRSACFNRFSRLGNRSYCQYVWDYYQNQ
ncbi:MAG: hypothetical protein N2482_01670 [Patescibacteria group bacterium]|nr:hypothetical protein [Patescibacteria group bacterium]